ncbi:MAG TPA: hypothetical protein [Caudoviricetes sp.]|nr:MAG TPA: hypothetical protein [Caudoviricetes sp.]
MSILVTYYLLFCCIVGIKLIISSITNIICGSNSCFLLFKRFSNTCLLTF